MNSNNNNEKEKEHKPIRSEIFFLEGIMIGLYENWLINQIDKINIIYLPGWLFFIQELLIIFSFSSLIFIFLFIIRKVKKLFIYIIVIIHILLIYTSVYIGNPNISLSDTLKFNIISYSIWTLIIMLEFFRRGEL